MSPYDRMCHRLFSFLALMNNLMAGFNSRTPHTSIQTIHALWLAVDSLMMYSILSDHLIFDRETTATLESQKGLLMVCFNSSYLLGLIIVIDMDYRK